MEDLLREQNNFNLLLDIEQEMSLSLTGKQVWIQVGEGSWNGGGREGGRHIVMSHDHKTIMDQLKKR